MATEDLTNETWALWAHLRLGRGGRPQLPVMEARRALGDKLDEVDGWRAWAQRALGLSDAYMADQMLTDHDLRRMISERL